MEGEECFVCFYRGRERQKKRGLGGGGGGSGRSIFVDAE